MLSKEYGQYNSNDAKVSPAKSSNKGYGDKNSFREVQGKLSS